MNPKARLISVLCLACACASTPAKRAVTNDVQLTPPAGSKRLPSSIACEPQPPCPGCIHGEAARRSVNLDPVVVRNIIRSHSAEVKACHDAVALSHPTMKGRMAVKFAISASGIVESSCLVRSDLNDTGVEQCVVDLPLSWVFPRPDPASWVTVIYPFVFAPGDDDS
jgi:hypothetical protein